MDNTFLADKIPTISFIFNEKSCKFYPDIYIPHINKIIEIKSTYTYEKHAERNKAKYSACLQQGYECEFWVFDRHGIPCDIDLSANSSDLKTISTMPTSSNSNNDLTQRVKKLEAFMNLSSVSPPKIKTPKISIIK